jgi:nitrate reductase alpha subunit
MKSTTTRREALKIGGSVFASLLFSGNPTLLSAMDTVGNLFDYYPSRTWEKVYRDHYSYDSTFNFLCVPNDTHNCRLTAFVRDGVALRVEQAYDMAGVADLYGNKVSAAWGPRGCLKGYSLVQRIYGAHRHKFPTIRKGWLEWARAGFPREGNYIEKYFKTRGEDERVRVSWDEALTWIAKATMNIAQSYGGEEGAKLLEKQGYPRPMIDKLAGVGTQVIKMRSAITACGPVSKQGSLVRFANMLALLDSYLRKVEPAKALGARHWTTYEYLGDMDPGFPQVTGVNTFDVDMADMRHSKFIVMIGKNIVEHKMADVHWMVEGIERKAKIAVIGPDYNPTSQKSDYWVPVRPGSDTALLLGIANLLIRKKYHDVEFLKKHSDFPLLVRMDTLKKLRAADIIPGYKNAENTGYSKEVQQIDPKLRAQWGDYVVWDAKTNQPAVLTREEVGDKMVAKGVDPVLDGEYTLQTVDGKTVKCRTGFSIQKEVLAYYTLDRVCEITTTPRHMIEQLAEDMGTIKPFAIHSGEGVNHYYHADLKGRAAILLCTLTGNLGKFGAGPGTWAGNYKVNSMDGVSAYVAEDPFNANEPAAPKIKKYYTEENPVFWVNGGPTWATGKTHMPTPTKMMWTANTNMLNNAPWLYKVINSELPKVELVINNDWEYNLSCEYSDIALPVPSWMETTLPDITGSASNPFCSIWKGGLKPIFDTKMDAETVAGVARKFTEMTGDPRFEAYYKYILEGKAEHYIQRIMNASSTLKGYNCEEILKSGKSVLMNFRTYPRITGYEQIQESAPFYNKTGRLEFYREEDTFIKEGENVVVHREPIEATRYLPNVIVCGTAEALRPERRDIPLTATSADEKSKRNVVMEWEAVKNMQNPLLKDGYRFVFITTKTRHSTHSSWMMADWNQVWGSSFGDPYRSDKRSPGAGEPELRINPNDGKSLGINDGDYVYVDANSEDRPYVGWKPDDVLYQAARLKLRARYDPRTRPGMVISRHAPWAATPRTVAAQRTRKDGRTLTDSGYESNFRSGSLQSCVRMYCQPTMMTDDLVRKNSVGQGISQGQGNDAYGVNTPYKESLVKLTKAEDGGIGGHGPWEPTLTGFTPGNESQTMRDYIEGNFLKGKS